MIKHYVEFLYPGSFVSETSVSEIASRDKKPTLPKGAFGYRFFDKTEVTTADGEKLTGARKNVTGIFYVGKELTAQEFLNSKDCTEIARSNIQGNGYKRVVKTKTSLFPLEDGDVVLQD